MATMHDDGTSAAAVFAEWFRRQGYRVLRTASSYWYEAGPRVYQAIPYHWTIEPAKAELRSLLLAHGAMALRYSAPLRAPLGKVSYHIVCEDPAYDLSSLSRQARQNVCRGLDYARVEPIPLSRLAEEGWALRADSLERQGRAGAEDAAWWRRLCESAQGLPGFEAWGALHDGQLLASFLAFSCAGCYTLPYEQSASAGLQHRANNAIFFAVTQAALERPGMASVFFCLQSLDAPPSMDQFKLRMGLTAKAVRQRVVFHPWLAPLCTRAGHALLRRLLASRPGQHTLAKAEGMLRFYLEGRRPVQEQDLPEPLRDQFAGPAAVPGSEGAHRRARRGAGLAG
ncbi:MAG TPA: hypothetical protein PLJ35_18190 [Anaerolineae bacterium]|nr:hypothetical protein [Anaerolineae bacterium]HPL27251.1 hypothetical protein [Anaerolineae bacterium]